MNMESEELEQIPWANLVAEQTDGIDKRIYMGVGVVAILVVLIFGMRMFGGSGQPVPLPMESLPAVTAVEITPTPSPMVVTEADLRADEAPVPVQASSNLLAEVTAEWFVTDWFTRDGSGETVRSIRAVLSADLKSMDLPHDEPDADVVFVEWAKTVEIETISQTTVGVTIAYRSIRQTDEGFVRNPVETVVVILDISDDSAMVTAVPIQS